MGKNNRRELLVEGGKSYPQALAALREFCELVYATVRDAIRRDLDLISRSLGVDISASEIADFARPYELGPGINGENATLGIVIRRDSKVGWNLYYTLCWSAQEEDPFYFTASIWFRQPAARDRAYRAFQKVQTILPVLYDGSEIYMKRKLANGDLTHFPEIVREVIHEWAKAWSQVGGLKTFSAPRDD